MTNDQRTSRLRDLFSWLDRNILLVISGFLLAFIPLYPKLPLADVLPGYIVRLRLEDLLIAVASLIWFIQVFRRKVTLKTPLTLFIGAYLLVGLASSLSAIYITGTVPQTDPHVLKLFLHYFRRIEYFSVFFIAYSSIRRKKDVVLLLGVFVISMLLVGLYGMGQKYLYWPVYSTMNREFSKGVRLYLTQHARVQSTFGGHYDYAAFLVIALPLLAALTSFVKRRLFRFILSFTYLISLWGLMMTSSRSSFLAYVAAMVIFLVLFALRKGILWGLSRTVLVFAVTALFLVYFGDLLERFGQVFKDNSAYLALYETVSEAKQITQAPIVDVPKNAISVDEVIPPVIDVSDTLPSPVQPTPLPPDVYEDIPNAVITTKNPYGEDVEVIVPRVFSENAHRLGLSAAIRLDTLWPFAIRGFLLNPFLGSGYSTLTKYTVDQFTEAESTDNDFLRTLGETGALGFITFYGTMIAAIVSLWKSVRRNKDELLYLLATTFTAVTFGLFVNALYIDVFVSSKVIETYWLFGGISLAYAMMLRAKNKSELAPSVALQRPAGKKSKTTRTRRGARR